jgi:outer membrane immunogenic protein
VRKIILAGLAVASTCVSSALAASPTFSWTGFYVGVNAGYSWGRDSGPITLGSSFSDDKNTSLDGFIGGGQLGYNWQNANWIYGIEVDFQGSAQKGSADAVCPGGTTTSVNSCTRGHVGDTLNDPALPVGVSLSEKLQWLGTVRGRIGTTLTPTVLPYITGGLAYGQVKVNENVSGTNVNGVNGANGATFTPGGGSFSKTTTKVGWTIGAGVEGTLWGNWTGRIEYLYVDLGTVSGSFATTLIAPSGNNLEAGFSSHVTDNIVRVGLNYTFH